MTADGGTPDSTLEAGELLGALRTGTTTPGIWAGGIPHACTPGTAPYAISTAITAGTKVVIRGYVRFK